MNPLSGAAPVLPAARPDAPVTLKALDLNKDGRRDLLVLPDWKDGLVFQRTGLAAWPLALNGGETVRFHGDPFKQSDDGFIYSGRLRPTLYYAGFKELVFADVDGDGLVEADLSYSTEDGAAQWKVVRYRWEGSYYEASSEWVRPAAETVPPERFLAWLKALEPLPPPPTIGKGSITLAARLQAMQVRRLDINHDGIPETLLVYGVEYGTVPDFWLETNGVAVFDAADRLVWQEFGKPATLFRDGKQRHAGCARQQPVSRRHRAVMGTFCDHVRQCSRSSSRDQFIPVEWILAANSVEKGYCRQP